MLQSIDAFSVQCKLTYCVILYSRLACLAVTVKKSVEMNLESSWLRYDSLMSGMTMVSYVDKSRIGLQTILEYLNVDNLWMRIPTFPLSVHGLLTT